MTRGRGLWHELAHFHTARRRAHAGEFFHYSSLAQSLASAPAGVCVTPLTMHCASGPCYVFIVVDPAPPPTFIESGVSMLVPHHLSPPPPTHPGHWLRLAIRRKKHPLSREVGTRMRPPYAFELGVHITVNLLNACNYVFFSYEVKQ